MPWTEITRPQYRRDGLRYASDATDEEWALIEPHLPPAKPLGRPRLTDLREVVNAVLYLLTGGCQWRMLPKEFPPYSTVQWFFYAWRDDGTWQRIHHALPMPAPEPPSGGGARGRGPRGEPVGGDHRQPVGPDHRGRRAARARCRQEGQGPQAPHRHRHERVPGRGDGARRQHSEPAPAKAGDRDGAVPLLASIRHSFPWLRHVFADGAYAGAKLETALAALGQWSLEIVKRPPADVGFEVLPRPPAGPPGPARSAAGAFACWRGWMVERTFAWLGRNRRLAKDFEALIATATAWLMLASIKLLTRRLARS
jgi:transposase